MFGHNRSQEPKITSSNDEKTHFLEHAKQAREERARRVIQEKSSILIQAFMRGISARRFYLATIRKNLDDIINYSDEQTEYTPSLSPALALFPHAQRFIRVARKSQTFTKRFECFCKHVIHSLSSDNMKMNYLSLLLNKELAGSWIEHIKYLLLHCLHCLTKLQPDTPAELRSINTLLTVLVSFTSTLNWKLLSGKRGDVLRPAMNQICANILSHIRENGFYVSMEVLLFNGLVKTKPCFKPATMCAVCTLLLRVYLNKSKDGERGFLLHILSVPALTYHMAALAPEIYLRFMGERLITHCLQYLSDYERLQALAVTLEGNRTLCLLANVIHLGFAEVEGVVMDVINFTTVVNRLLQVCGQCIMGKKQTSKSHWHPILGWAAQPFNHNEAVPYIMRQLQVLWSNRAVSILFADMNDFASTKDMSLSSEDGRKSGLKKKKDKKPTTLKADSNLLRVTCSACVMYQAAITVLIQIQAEILSGLAFNSCLLRNLWLLMKGMGSTSHMVKIFLDTIGSEASSLNVSSMLTLFADAAVMLFMILDDVEVYEEQKPFSLSELVELSDLLNQLVFRIIWYDVIDYRKAESDPVFTSAHSLLQLLHERDSRRAFAPPDLWIIKDVRPAQFISCIDKGNKTSQFLLQKMPHVVGHKDRVILFRKLVQNDKESQGIADSANAMPNITYINVSRRRLLEDGYNQLAGLPPVALKGLIRVKFINAQGLDEAGIDQDGVFKEFLEETIKKVFDPGLNLFMATAEQKLYPSPTSSVQENHLQLFEFVGRILGKAVYEGIVVDVPFAPFFLTQVLDNTKNSMYSYLDELPSLDPELYKNLAYVKHYDGDIEELELNFSYDENVMGKLQNYELKPGGRAISVTNANKISYVHYMARFKMHTRIREQTKAFIRGFGSIVSYEWLQMFSTPEVQKLISGDTIDIDLADLRKHTQYYGGFHNNHRVVNWLWDILQKDFNEKERGQFLKFITSCSKPPLLGFGQLEPPFSIRCVEVSDDQDTGDTIGSVLKGFFSIRKNEPAGRLPTSSTCFNLLKLPNYSKKRILRDKLRYSILNNTGFELS
ncbi:ubiquitin-protein ligase E3B-like [Watersipora subatra]|uniref:ubiquitin-protein ligase E3B-like n=1 Tax=Watersipora subatra TaxID=2589382 RepID=UPI00355B69BC